MLRESDEFKLKKYHNLILMELTKLKDNMMRYRFNFIYPHYSTLFEEVNGKLYFFIDDISYITDELGNYINTDKMFFTSNELFDGVYRQITDAENQIKLIFTLKDFNAIQETETPKLIDSTPEIDLSKSQLLNGKKLNLTDRYKIANKLLDIDNKINILNISKEQKNQLLAYILGCNIDNAKKILNGNYDSRPNDLGAYFNELGLNK